MFVFGATGFVGREVVRVARLRGHDVVAHVRPDSTRLTEWRERFEGLGAAVDTTAWEARSMAETFSTSRPDIVFCVIGTTRRRGRRAVRRGDPAETHASVDYGLTALLVDALVEAQVAPRFVYLSSMGADGRARGSYMRARQRAEEHIRGSGLPYTIARPAFIVGPGRDDRRMTERVGAAVVDGALAGLSLVGAHRLRQRFRSITNVELAERLVELALDEGSVNAIVEADGLRSA